MNRKSIIIVSAVVLVAAFSASAFAQKSGGSGRSKKGQGTQQKMSKGHSGHKHGSGQHHFGGSKSGKSSSHHHNFNANKHNGHHHGHANKFQPWNNHGHSFHGNIKHQRHNQLKQFHLKYVNAQHHFVVRSNLHLVQFHQFPYDVCWHNGKYWVSFKGTWMPYSYLISNHAGAWSWHQTHYRFHDHATFKKNCKNLNVRLIYGK